ncbi:PE family protein [Nocardia speluncae]|uniref:PE family protein n=1 Tax=Nocardia speluncae TaxID=419477 RepID=A0A846X778_9NOCA|nr:PE family protein [Nocardia speluncae]NKY31768.1 PE family protein [Nocardia speluncae]
MEYDPDRARGAALDLDALADRLDATLRTEWPLLNAPPAGSDEVSVEAAQTLRRVGESYSVSGDLAVVELRKLAATVRAQADGVLAMELSNADGFTAPVRTG